MRRKFDGSEIHIFDVVAEHQKWEMFGVKLWHVELISVWIEEYLLLGVWIGEGRLVGLQSMGSRFHADVEGDWFEVWCVE